MKRLLLISILVTSASAVLPTAGSAQKVVDFFRLDVNLLYAHGWGLTGPGVEGMLALGHPFSWVGMRHDVALTTSLAFTRGRMDGAFSVRRDLATFGATWRSRLVDEGRRVVPYILIPVQVVMGDLRAVDGVQELGDSRYSSQWGWRTALGIGLGAGVDWRVNRLLGVGVHSTLLYPTLVADRRLMLFAGVGVGLGGAGQ
jgi:hypothetical protein